MGVVEDQQAEAEADEVTEEVLNIPILHIILIDWRMLRKQNKQCLTEQKCMILVVMLERYIKNNPPSNKYSHGIVLSAHQQRVTGAISYKVGQMSSETSSHTHEIAVHGANLHELYHIH